MPKNSIQENATQENVLQVTKEIDTEKEELKTRLALLEKALLNKETLPAVVVPVNVVNESLPPLEKPKRIVYTIAAYDQEDAIHDGSYIPGKALVSAFKFIDRLKSNEYGTRFTTGFEQEDIESQSGLKGEALESYLKEVKIARQWLERYFQKNMSADNVNFWKERKIQVSSLDNIYDTEKSLENLLVYYNIMGGGFESIARSREEAKNSLDGKRLYISVSEEEEKRKFNYRESSMEAMAALKKIKDTWSRTDTLYLMYYLPSVGKYKGYTVNSPLEHILNELADFIDGVDTNTEKKKRPKMFLDAVQLMESGQHGKDTVRTTAIFNAAVYYNFISYNSKERNYKNRSTNFEYGNNSSRAIELLLDSKNIDELSWLKSKVVSEKWVN